MLEYVLLQHNRAEEQPSKVKENLKRILLLADARMLLQIQVVLNHPTISTSIKMELSNLLSAKSTPEPQNSQQELYDPFVQEEL